MLHFSTRLCRYYKTNPENIWSNVIYITASLNIDFTNISTPNYFPVQILFKRVD